jgi:hypothetical protein
MLILFCYLAFIQYEITHGMPQIESCKRNKRCIDKMPTRYFSWFPAIFIAILPKCPFCIMAYSGAVSMCSGKMLFPNAHSYSGYFIIGLSIVILLSILLNNKGSRTLVSAFIVSIGILLLAISQFVSMSEPQYYFACLIMFFGIWYNGSFTFF